MWNHEVKLCFLFILVNIYENRVMVEAQNELDDSIQMNTGFQNTEVSVQLAAAQNPQLPASISQAIRSLQEKLYLHGIKQISDLPIFDFDKASLLLELNLHEAELTVMKLWLGFEPAQIHKNMRTGKTILFNKEPAPESPVNMSNIVYLNDVGYLGASLLKCEFNNNSLRQMSPTVQWIVKTTQICLQITYPVIECKLISERIILKSEFNSTVAQIKATLSENQLLNLLNKYGTSLITESVIGGQLVLCNSTFPPTWKNISGASLLENMKESLTNLPVHMVGGNDFFHVRMSKSLWEENKYIQWWESIKENPEEISFKTQPIASVHSTFGELLKMLPGAHDLETKKLAEIQEMIKSIANSEESLKKMGVLHTELLAKLQAAGALSAGCNSDLQDATVKLNNLKAQTSTIASDLKNEEAKLKMGKTEIDSNNNHENDLRNLDASCTNRKNNLQASLKDCEANS